MKHSDEEEDMLARNTKKFKDRHLPSAELGGNEHEEDTVSDDEEEQEQEGSTRVCFSKEEKIHMRDPWKRAIIIKTFGRRLGFSFLVEKIRSMWKPTRNMDCIDLGFDFFLVKFELAIDVDFILKGGPWFIGQHYLAIRQWEPEFKASTATLSSVAVWIRLPELPIEFYETNALLEIGRAIGPVLRIDAHTATRVRRRFARLCVQSKGRVDNRPQQFDQSQTSEVIPEASSIATPKVAEQYKRDGKRKATHTQPGTSQWETSKTLKSNQFRGNLGKGAKVAGFRSKTNQRAKGVVENQQDKMGLGETKGLFSFGPSQGVVNNERANSSSFLFSSLTNTSNSPRILGKESGKSNSDKSRNGREREMGDFLQRKGDTSGRRDRTVDTAGPYRDMGLVRCKVNGSLEKFVPVDGVESTGGVLAIEGRGLGNNSKLVVEVSNGQTTSANHTADKLKDISTKIKGAELGKISIQGRSGVDSTSGFCEEETSRAPSGMRDDGQS
nr:hypothetical protein CFP56_04682 [Quercus suber]